MRCKPLSSRCLPLILGCSIKMASLVGVPGAQAMSLCSTTIESMDSGSMLKRGSRERDLGDKRVRNAIGYRQADSENNSSRKEVTGRAVRNTPLCSQEKERVGTDWR